MRIEELQYTLQFAPQHLSGAGSDEPQARLDERTSLLEEEAALAVQHEIHIAQLEILNRNPRETFLVDLEREKERRPWGSPVDLFASFLGLTINTSGNIVLPLEGTSF